MRDSCLVQEIIKKIEDSMYDRSIKKFDEPHSPEALEKATKSKNINGGKLIDWNYGSSYLIQLKTIINLNISSVLEIGPGDDFNSDYLIKNNIEYASMNLPNAANATYQARLEDFDEEKLTSRVDLVAAFQMLEHSPYENFIVNIRKMAHMSKQYIFISLPFDCIGFQFECALGFSQKSRKLTVGFWLPTYRKNRKYRAEYMKEFPWAVHHWEIGRRGYSLTKVLTDIQNQGIEIISKFHGKNPYHYFILAKKLDK